MNFFLAALDHDGQHYTARLSSPDRGGQAHFANQEASKIAPAASRSAGSRRFVTASEIAVSIWTNTELNYAKSVVLLRVVQSPLPRGMLDATG
jgi:hypothetical protein